MCEKEGPWGNEKEVILKSLLTMTTGILVFVASGVSACPFMDAEQKTTELSQDQTLQTLVENDVETTDPELLAKLLLQQEKEVN